MNLWINPYSAQSQSCGPFQTRACFPLARTAAVVGATVVGSGLIIAGINSFVQGKKK
jgi:hypothetical protein